MLPTRNVARYSFFRILSCDAVSNALSKCLIQESNIQCRRNFGYKHSNLNVANYKIVAKFSSETNQNFSPILELTPVQFEKISDETLESLTEYFDELIEQAAHLPDADVSYGDGVLTVKFGNPYGTYVINRQTPNKQIWLSSPKSGPKRYDFVNGKWIYKHDGRTLHELLNNEIPAIVRDQTNFDKCSFSGKEREAAMKDL